MSVYVTNTVNVSELRIGNKILVETAQSRSYYAVIDTIYEDSFTYNVDRRKYGVPVRTNPIPLSPELLEKCGFEKRYGNTWFYERLKFSYEKNELSEFVRFHYSGKVTYLNSLHGLQNLVYALTGKELEVEL